MVGYACNENEEMIPQEFYLARSLCKFIYEKYQEDGKTQITINNNKEIVDIVVSFNNATTKDLNDLVLSWLTTQSHLDNVKIHINPAGDWSIGSFDADTGLTGRKIVCDAYGSNVPVGGGAFSGKDPSKVDRSAAYAARNIAKKFVKDLDLDYCLVKIAYSIGLDYPLMVEIEGKDKDGKVIDNDILEEFSKSLQPKAIVERFHLLEIPYSEVAEWGSFGNGFEWDL
jgi:S-adenosylmethionine synthetase